MYFITILNAGIFLRAGHFETSNIVSFLNNFSENSDEAFDVEMILNLKRYKMHITVTK